MTPPDVGGIVVVDKPPGWTSHDVVGRLRRLAGTRRVGHAGTLDPRATGVLVLGVGRATRLLGHLMLTQKEYVATIRLGACTSTDDADGELLGRTDASGLDPDMIAAARDGFIGDLHQVPSSVSAIKVDGKRAYARVRAGEDVALAARPVRVESFELTDVREVGDGWLDVDATVVCSSGTYVRALARDLGTALAVGGHLTMLRRTRVGPFTLRQARTLDQLADRLHVVPIGSAARSSFAALDLDEATAAIVRHGRVLEGVDLGARSPVALFDPAGQFLALYEQRGADGRAVAVFV